MSIEKSKKHLSPYLYHMGIREGLSFSDYFDDSVPADVKPVHNLTPMQEESNTDGNIQGYGWMDKNGKYYKLDYDISHEGFAIEYLNSIGALPKTNKLFCYITSIYKKMYELGFLRIITGNFNKNIYFSYNYPTQTPTNIQLRELKNAAIERGYNLVDGSSGRNVELNEVKNLWESIDIKKYTSYWLDKSGQFHGTIHHDTWARMYFNRNKIEYNKDFIYSAMYRLGFIRVYISTIRKLVSYDYGTPKYFVATPTHKQLSELKNIAIELGYFLHDDTKNVNVELMELSNLNQNKELFIENMMPDDMKTFKIHLVQLFAYLQKELQLKTVPDVKLTSDDKNANKILGKTAYYDPDKKLVVLYITNRHQKDILRSFAHEVIHHWQHENGKLSDKKSSTKDPEYAQKDPWMRQMEKQAYLLGNILFRDWSDKKVASDRKMGKKDLPKTNEQHGRGNVSCDSDTPIIKKYYKPEHPYRKHVEGPVPEPNDIKEKTSLIGIEYLKKKNKCNE